MAELFNVNFFIVSQARPYLIPFLRSDVDGPDISSIRRSIARRGRRGAAVSSPSTLASLSAFLARVVGLEIRHRLRQLDTLRLLPLFLRRLLVDDWIPGSGSGSVTSAGGSSGIGFGAGGLGSGVGGNCITLVPRVTAGDFLRLLLETPRRDTLDAWILRGQRSVWPAVAALRVRCAVEVELERAYQRVRTLKPGRGGGGGAGGGGSGGGPRGRGPAPIPGAQEGTTMNSLRTAANDAAAADHSGVAGTGAGTTVGPTQRRRWTDGQIEEGHAE